MRDEYSEPREGQFAFLPADLRLRLWDALGYSTCAPEDLWDEVTGWMEDESLRFKRHVPGNDREISGISAPCIDAGEGGDLNFLGSELRNRTLDLLSILQIILRRSMLASQTLSGFTEDLQRQLAALARSAQLVGAFDAESEPTLDKLVDGMLADLDPAVRAASKISIAGIPGVLLSFDTLQILGLALHDLFAESRAFGALATSGGQLSINWSIAVTAGAPALHIDWVETVPPHGAPMQRAPGRAEAIVTGALRYQLRAEANYRWSDRRLDCAMRIPLPRET